MSSKTWFITGTSRGFGREWTEAALERGDPVAATARDASSLDDLVQKYGDAAAADRARRHRPGGRLRRRRAGARALRPARRRRQQRRLRPVRHGRGAQRGRGPRPDGDQPVRRAVGHPGGAAAPARAGQRPHHPGVLHRRHLGVPDGRDLPRVQVGAGGLQPVAGPGGRRLRHQGHARSSPAASPPTGAAARPSTPSRSPATTRCARGQAANAARAAAAPRRPVATAEAILQVVDAEEPPLRVFFGEAPLAIATADYESRLKTWNEWQHVALTAQGS